MNPKEILDAIIALLGAAIWPAGEVVFSGVHATTGVAADAFVRLSLPAALIALGASTPDEEEPGLQRQEFLVTVCQASAGDGLGEGVLLGANRTGGAGSSRGKGLAEIEERLKTTLQKLGPAGGVRLVFASASDAAAIRTEEVNYAASRTYTFWAWCLTASGQ